MRTPPVRAERAWVYDAAPRVVRRAVLVGRCSLFLLDSTGSIALGNASNVLFNVLVLTLAEGPLWGPAGCEADPAQARADARIGMAAVAAQGK